jgi:hypothetical protein
MAGMGPAPKKPAIRRRRNKTTTRKTVETPPAPELLVAPAWRPPELPRRPCGCAPGAKRRRCTVCRGKGVQPWHAMTLAWWRDVWASEFRDEYIRTDEHGLLRVAIVVDGFNWRPNLDDLKEIRLQEARFGLDVMSRRRLEWTVKRAPSTPQRPPTAGARAAASGEDPRRVLSMVPKGGKA